MSTDNEELSLTLLLGGVRAGKSARALQLAETRSQGDDAVLFVATAQAFDAEMKKRISAHQSERPTAWRTLEEPIEIATGIAQHLEHHPETSVIVVDCLTLWVSNILLGCGQDDDVEVIVSNRTHDLLNVMREHSSHTNGDRTLRHWIVVSNEVGLGVVPPTVLGRQYRDALGRANQLMAAAANSVTLMVAGLELPLKTSRMDNKPRTEV